MRCFKCHDHKFDPLPTRDYYRIYAAFAGTQMAERPAPFLDEENRDGFDEGKAFVERMLAFATAEKDDDRRRSRGRPRRPWYRGARARRTSPKAARKNSPTRRSRRATSAWTTPTKGSSRSASRTSGSGSGPWNATSRWPRASTTARTSLRLESARQAAHPRAIRPEVAAEEHASYTGGSLEAPGAQGAARACSAPSACRSKERGDDPYVLPETSRPAARPGEVDRRPAQPADDAVDRQPRLAVPLRQADRRQPEQLRREGGQADPPRTARLAGGRLRRARLDAQAAAPAHHDLAGLSPVEPPSATWTSCGTKDPDNDLLAFFPPRRLTAEELRDSHAAGHRRAEPGHGRPARHARDQHGGRAPAADDPVLARPGVSAVADAARAEPPAIYAYRVRGLADPFLEVFNQPNPNDSCEVRDTAAVSPQAFTLLNSDVDHRPVDRPRRAPASGRRRPAASRSIGRSSWRSAGAPTPAERERLTAYVRRDAGLSRGRTPRKARTRPGSRGRWSRSSRARRSSTRRSCPCSRTMWPT